MQLVYMQCFMKHRFQGQSDLLTGSLYFLMWNHKEMHRVEKEVYCIPYIYIISVRIDEEKKHQRHAYQKQMT